MVATRARWRVGVSFVRERLRGCFGESRSDELAGIGENAGLKGKSRESLAKVMGLSAMVECVGAGERGRDGLSERRVDVPGEGAGEPSAEDDSTLLEEVELSGARGVSVEGRDLPWAARARTTAS